MKNIVFYLSLAWVLLFSSAAGCSSSNDPTPASSSSLEGTWKLTKVNGQLTIITDAKKVRLLPNISMKNPPTS